MTEDKDWENEDSSTNEKKSSRVLFSFKEFFSIFTEFVQLCKETGPLRVAGYVVFFLVTAYAVHMGTHPDVIFEKYEEYVEQKHSASFNYRMKNSPQVQSYLDQMRLETDAIRTFIIEMHNGKYNAAGLSFNYGALTYESVEDGYNSVMDDYIDFSLERYPMLGQIYSEGMWYGTVESLMEKDKHLAFKLKSNEVEFFAATMIYGTKGDIGFIGLTYDTIPSDADIKMIRQNLMKYSNKVSPLLDGTEAQKKTK